uniref:heparan-sulfate 6-O-sulfotransferase 1-like n=1 Tax=Myxine glutinosa TaxID=7769 RepID=UPI00358ECEF9
MEERSRFWGKLALSALAAITFLTIAYQYVCPGTTCRLDLLLSAGSPVLPSSPTVDEDLMLFPTPDPFYSIKFRFSPSELEIKVHFDVKSDDVIVFLHIQKTGGTTFGRHLVKNIRLEVPCACKAGQKKCVCPRPGKKGTWLFSRFSTGWSCGLHADWTELVNCVPGMLDKKESVSRSRNYYYITMLRDPVWRYLSEWRHVQRGATWKSSLHMCDGRAPTPGELPPCYEGDDWAGVTLPEFVACPYNLANNRQVRMLADLNLVGCYNVSYMPQSNRNQALLDSAKLNLRRMAFFGLTEFQRRTQFLFERTFNLRFIAPFTQFNNTRAGGVTVGNATMAKIQALNHLDVQLYEYARDLFLQRYQLARRHDRQQRRHRWVGHTWWTQPPAPDPSGRRVGNDGTLGTAVASSAKQQLHEDYLGRVEKW